MLFNFLEIDFVIGNVFIENFEDKLDKNINYIKSILRNQYLFELSTPNLKKPLIYVGGFCFSIGMSKLSFLIIVCHL